jgi:hypothetical protein
MPLTNQRADQTYDTHSWDLAEFFLEDEPDWAKWPGEQRRALTHELAITIQQSIEGWIEEKRGEGWKPEST